MWDQEVSPWQYPQTDFKLNCFRGGDDPMRRPKQFVFFLLLSSPEFCSISLHVWFPWSYYGRDLECGFFFFILLQVFNENYMNQQAGTPQLVASRPPTNQRAFHLNLGLHFRNFQLILMKLQEHCVLSCGGGEKGKNYVVFPDCPIHYRRLWLPYPSPQQ